MKCYVIVGLLPCLLLTGCANQSFDCPPDQGVGCQSIMTVHSQVNACQRSITRSSIDITMPSLPPNNALKTPPFTKLKLKDGRYAQWIPEDIRCIWLPPYHDTHGQFHESRFVYTVIQAGYWQIKG
jgi:hypothetical protein